MAGAWSYVTAQEEVDELFDDHLRSVAQALQHPRLTASRSHETPKAGEEEDELVVQVWNGKGVLTYVDDTGPPMPRLETTGFSDFTWKGRLWRGYLMEDQEGAIQTAQPISVRTEISATMALRNVLPSLLLVPVLGLFIWIAVGRGLKPLRDIAAELRTRTPDALEALPEHGLPGEVQPMVGALNNLLRRLDVALETQRQFIADAAHELRTPLTALRLQLDILEQSKVAEEKQLAVNRLEQGLWQVSHLVQQLLILARLDPENRNTPRQLIDLNGLVKSALADHALLAESRGIDLGMVRSEEAHIIGDGDSLYCAFGNLLDNAIRYTPNGGRVDVSVWQEDGVAILEVVDSGVGISPEDLARVFDRFYRVPGNDQPGSGLGIAIAKKAADRHHGTITLSPGNDGRGLRATIKLPGVLQKNDGSKATRWAKP